MGIIPYLYKKINQDSPRILSFPKTCDNVGRLCLVNWNVEVQGIMDKKLEKWQQVNTVLLVDDDPTATFLAKRVMLRTWVGRELLTAHNGPEALQTLKAFLAAGARPPELIFLDINMPMMDGFEVLAEIATWPDLNFQQTRVYLCSSSSHAKDKQ